MKKNILGTVEFFLPIQLQYILSPGIQTPELNNGSINFDSDLNVNIALNKPTHQSSIYHIEQYGYDPYGACNGNKTGGFGFHTLEDNQPWWQIDLQGIYKISKIIVYNRLDCCQERASTLNILFSDNALDWELGYSNDKDNIFNGSDGKPLVVHIEQKVARFVRLQLREKQFFHLDEVEIYGVATTTDNSSFESSQDGGNLSKNFYGGSPFKPTPRLDSYKLLRFLEIDKLHSNNIISDITAISIEGSGRFGNSIVQLSHAYHTAKVIGAPRIYLPDFWYIPQGKSKTESGIELINVSQADFSSEKIVLEGMFFFYGPLIGLSNTKLNHYLNMIELMEVTNLKYPSQSLSEQDLVIHIRSGDIFTNNPHLHYGQAPLSFYQKIIELQSWHSISLVFEDKSNPIIDPLIDFSKKCCMQVQEISGDLRSDIEYLLRAKILVVSSGTFAPAIATISRNLETVYYFEGGFSSWGNPNILSIRVTDKQGIYKSKILSGNWRNTESQQKLMLEYPIDALDFDPMFTS